jgi:hypothetical protein
VATTGAPASALSAIDTTGDLGGRELVRRLVTVEARRVLRTPAAVW